MTCEADLHIHTTASDGTLTPTQVVEVAAEIGLRAVSLCDHDTISGLEEAIAAGHRLGVDVVPGVEINTDVGPLEIHILGYFFNWRSEKFQARLEELKTARVKRGRKIVEKLQAIGVPVTVERVLQISGSASVGRPHIARAICETGYADSMNSAFGKYLIRGAPAFVERYRLTPQDAMNLIISAGGVTGLAHPAKLHRDGLIPEFVKFGLRALEVYHGDAHTEISDRYNAIARHYNLIPTGGSDAHGFDPDLPSTIGTVGVAYEIVERLRASAG